MNCDSIQKEELMAIIDSIEEIERQRGELGIVLNELFDDAKSKGYDKKILKQIIKLRKTDEEKRKEESALLELYQKVLDMD